MTSRPSGPHGGQEPSPGDGEPPRHASADPSGAHSARPLLRVVKGEPTAEEVAALTVVVATLSQRRSRRRPTPVGTWASHADAHRQVQRPGPGGWRASGRSA